MNGYNLINLHNKYLYDTFTASITLDEYYYNNIINESYIDIEESLDDIWLPDSMVMESVKDKVNNMSNTVKSNFSGWVGKLTTLVMKYVGKYINDISSLKSFLKKKYELFLKYEAEINKVKEESNDTIKVSNYSFKFTKSLTLVFLIHMYIGEISGVVNSDNDKNANNISKVINLLNLLKISIEIPNIVSQTLLMSQDHLKSLHSDNYNFKNLLNKFSKESYSKNKYSDKIFSSKLTLLSDNFNQLKDNDESWKKITEIINEYSSNGIDGSLFNNIGEEITNQFIKSDVETKDLTIKDAKFYYKSIIEIFKQISNNNKLNTDASLLNKIVEHYNRIKPGNNDKLSDFKLSDDTYKQLLQSIISNGTIFNKSINIIDNTNKMLVNVFNLYEKELTKNLNIKIS